MHSFMYFFHYVPHLHPNRAEKAMQSLEDRARRSGDFTADSFLSEKANRPLRDIARGPAAARRNPNLPGDPKKDVLRDSWVEKPPAEPRRMVRFEEREGGPTGEERTEERVPALSLGDLEDYDQVEFERESPKPGPKGAPKRIDVGGIEERLAVAQSGIAASIEKSKLALKQAALPMRTTARTTGAARYLRASSDSLDE